MSNLEIHTLQGLLNDDCLTVVLTDTVPHELQSLLRDGTVTSGEFDGFEPGERLEFDVRISGSKGRENMVVNKQSVKKLNGLSSGNSFDGWETIESAYFAPEDTCILNLTTPTLERGGAYNLKFTGESGYGKTVRAEAWAKHRDMRFAEVNCGVLRQPADFFGYRGVTDNATTFEETTAAGAMQIGNAVILLDEINRVAAWVKNGLMSILDYRRRGEIFGKEIKVGPSVLFIATVNIGHQYTGTFDDDAALNNRFAATLRVGPPPPRVEVELLMERYPIEKEDAEKIVVILNELRQDKLKSSGMLRDCDIDITTRTAVYTAELMFNGATLKDAFLYTLINQIQDDEKLQKNIMDRIGEYT